VPLSSRKQFSCGVHVLFQVFVFTAGLAQVIVGLEVDPEPCLHLEEITEAERVLAGDPPFAVDQLIEANIGDARTLGDCLLREPHRFDELLQQQRARGIQRDVVVGFHSALMVVGDFNVACVAIVPAKTDTPLIVDANTVPVFSVATEGFEMITRGNSQGFQLCRRGNETELVQCALLNVAGKLLRVAALENFGRFFATEALYH